MASGTIQKEFVVRYASKDNWTIAGSSSAYADIDISNLGDYYPIGVIGVDTYNASSSGVRADRCLLIRFTVLVNTGQVRISYRNGATDSAKIQTHIKVLCQKNTAT